MRGRYPYQIGTAGDPDETVVAGEEKKGIVSIKSKILDEYEVSPREAEVDLSAFVTDLIEIEAVTRV